MVSRNDTLVNKEVTSKLTRTSFAEKVCDLIRSRNWVEGLAIYSLGIKGLIILSKYLDRPFSAVPIIETTGLSGYPSLWTLPNPNNLPGTLPDGRYLYKSSSSTLGLTYLFT